MATKTIPDGRRWYTPAEAGQVAGLSKKAINREINAGRLRAYYMTRVDGTPSNRRKISAEDLDAYMRRNVVRAWAGAAYVVATMIVGMAWPMIEGLPW